MCRSRREPSNFCSALMFLRRPKIVASRTVFNATFLKSFSAHHVSWPITGVYLAHFFQFCQSANSVTWGICTRRAGKLDRARPRLYRTQFLQINICWKALAEIYTMHSFAPFSNLNFFVKNRQTFFAIE